MSPPKSENPAAPSLPQLSTSPASSKRTNLQRPSSYAKDRLSMYSNTSYNSQNRSRPVSHAFPVFHSSLPYALVRDFAYPAIHPLHYGPLPVDSAASTPVSEMRRLSDPPPMAWDGSRGHDSWNPDAMYSTQQLPAVAFGDGPPYSEDEDLHSPIVTTSRHRKHKSSYSTGGRGRSPGNGNQGEGVFISVNGDGSETYYVRDDDDDAVDDGPGGEYVTYDADDGSHSHLHPNSYAQDGDRYMRYSTLDDGRLDPDMAMDSDDDISDGSWQDRSRFSRDYQFTIVSPDEEMHGKAVALFDFAREHENELPLTEGQVILVSYRHGQGWLVAEDPKTGESGLVPEEFVRLLRDIEGGLSSLNGALLNTSLEGDSSAPDSASTPTQDDTTSDPSTESTQSTNGGAPSEDDNNDRDAVDSSNNKDKTHERDKVKEREKHPPVVSTFSTSSRDLAPYPLGGHQHRKSTPPQIEHYGHLSGNGNASSRRPNSISKPLTRSGTEPPSKP